MDVGKNNKYTPSFKSDTFNSKLRITVLRETPKGFKTPKKDGLFIMASKHNHAHMLQTYRGEPYPD